MITLSMTGEIEEVEIINPEPELVENKCRMCGCLLPDGIEYCVECVDRFTPQLQIVEN